MKTLCGITSGANKEQTAKSAREAAAMTQMAYDSLEMALVPKEFRRSTKPGFSDISYTYCTRVSAQPRLKQFDVTITKTPDER